MTAERESRTSALLPCPFCGEPPTRADRTDNYTPTKHVWFIFCYCGGLSANAHQFGATEAEVIEKWNRRSTPSESEDSKDAARYRWLRNHPRRQFTPEQETEWWPSVWMSETAAYPLQAAFLDEAVDNAMRREVNDLLVAEYGPLHERDGQPYIKRYGENDGTDKGGSGT